MWSVQTDANSSSVILSIDAIQKDGGKAATLRRRFGFVWFIVTIATLTSYRPRVVRATQAVGFASTTVIHQKFDKDDILSKSLIPGSNEDDWRVKAWLSQQKPAEPSDLYVQSNVWQSRGSTGWHTHPGLSLIIVTEGIVTDYEGPAPDCKPHVYTKGMTFEDPHGDHAHIIRNEGLVVARTMAIQLIPAGTARRIDVADPENCHF